MPRARISLDVDSAVKARLVKLSKRHRNSLTATVEAGLRALEMLVDPKVDALLYKDGSRVRAVF